MNLLQLFMGSNTDKVKKETLSQCKKCGKSDFTVSTDGEYFSCDCCGEKYKVTDYIIEDNEFGIINKESLPALKIIMRILDKEEVPYLVDKRFDGWGMKFSWNNGDIACHQFTYGFNEGRVETYGMPWDEDDVSILEPIMVADHIIQFYHNEFA